MYFLSWECTRFKFPLLAIKKSSQDRYLSLNHLQTSTTDGFTTFYAGFKVENFVNITREMGIQNLIVL